MGKTDVFNSFTQGPNFFNGGEEVGIGGNEDDPVRPIFVGSDQHVDGHGDINAFFVETTTGFEEVAKKVVNFVFFEVGEEFLLAGVELP